MPKFEVYATKREHITKTLHLHAVIEADSLEEAELYADEEMLTEDFGIQEVESEMTNTDFTLGDVIEIEVANA